MDERNHVYILANKPRGVLYVGVTSNLPLRVEQHKAGVVRGFTAKHSVNRLVWFTAFAYIRDTIDHEKRLKKWRRTWKIKLIEESNPNWDDLQPW